MVCLLSDWKNGESHLTKANDTMKPGIQFTYDLDGDGQKYLVQTRYMAVDIDGDQKEEIALLEYNIGSNYGAKTLKILSLENNQWVEVKIPETMQQETGIIDVTVKYEEEGDILEFLVYNGETENIFEYSYRNDEWVLK